MRLVGGMILQNFLRFWLGKEVDYSRGAKLTRLLVLIYIINLTVVAKMVINDFLRGKIPWYVPDPNWPEHKPGEKDEEMESEEVGLEMKINNETDESDEDDSGVESWDGFADEPIMDTDHSGDLETNEVNEDDAEEGPLTKRVRRS
jgi:hypothetical protein